MMSRFGSINLYLLSGLLLACGLAAACRSPDGTSKSKLKKEISTLRLHLEVNPDGSHRTIQASIYRESPLMIAFHREPFLTEADVILASVEEIQGIPAVRVRFNRHGTFALDMMTNANRGRRIGVFSQFGDARWLAAPVIGKRIADGTLIFTPDATREEAERIVRGLNNVAAKLNQKATGL